jgi:DNA polymerase
MPAKVPAPAAAPAPRALPDNLADFVTWMMTDPSVPEAGPPTLRLRPFGTAGAPLLIVTDMPELGDADSGQLMSGAVGQLFEAMLAAMGQDRQSVYCLPLCPGRPPTGRLPNSALKDLGDLACHHIALAEPKAVWLLGQATSRALIGADSTATLDKIGQNINHFRGKVPCIASLHPRLLIQAPQRKASVWKDMQVLIGGLT